MEWNFVEPKDVGMVAIGIISIAYIAFSWTASNVTGAKIPEIKPEPSKAEKLQAEIVKLLRAALDLGPDYWVLHDDGSMTCKNKPIQISKTAHADFSYDFSIGDKIFDVWGWGLYNKTSELVEVCKAQKMLSLFEPPTQKPLSFEELKALPSGAVIRHSTLGVGLVWFCHFFGQQHRNVYFADRVFSISSRFYPWDKPTYLGSDQDHISATKIDSPQQIYRQTKVNRC